MNDFNVRTKDYCEGYAVAMRECFMRLAEIVETKVLQVSEITCNCMDEEEDINDCI